MHPYSSTKPVCAPVHSARDLAPVPLVVRPVVQLRQEGPELNWPWGQVTLPWHSGAVAPGRHTVEVGKGAHLGRGCFMHMRMKLDASGACPHTPAPRT